MFKQQIVAAKAAAATAAVAAATAAAATTADRVESSEQVNKAKSKCV